MEMEFKDNSRRRTMVLVVGVLLALGAGAAAFMLSSQGTDEPTEAIPLRDVVVASSLINARDTIQQNQVTTRAVPLDATNETAFSSPLDVAGKIAAIPIYENQPITPNMLAQATGVGQIDILEPDATVAPDSPYLRAVSLTVPPERAVGGLVAVDQRVDVIATMPFVEFGLFVSTFNEAIANGKTLDVCPRDDDGTAAFLFVVANLPFLGGQGNGLTNSLRYG